MREVAATFVDIVKFAMRGLLAPTVASFGEGFLVDEQQKWCSIVSRQRATGTGLVTYVRRLFFVSAFCVGGLVACASAMAASPYPLLGREAPDFALHALVGSNVRLSESLGDVVVVTFWGSRCGPCGMQLGALNRSLSTYSSVGLRVFGISVDDDQGRALDYAKGQSVAFPLLLDPSKSVSRLYEVDNLPMTVLIDRGGVVRHVHRDYSTKDEALYLQELRALLNE